MHEDEHRGRQLTFEDHISKEDELAKLISTVLNRLVNLGQHLVLSSDLDPYTVVEELFPQQLLNRVLYCCRKQTINGVQLFEDTEELANLLQEC